MNFNSKSELVCDRLLKTEKICIPFEINPVGFTPAVPGRNGPSMGTLGTYAIVAGSAITASVASTLINGGYALSPGSSVTGSITSPGPNDVDDPAAVQAQLDLTTAYNGFAGLTPTMSLTGQVLGTGGTVSSLTAGVYSFSSSAQLTGTLTLDGGGNPNAIFVFQIGTTLTTASASSIVLINSASAGNVFWTVGSAATFGTTSTFVGQVMAVSGITDNGGGTFNGGLYSRTAAPITLNNSIVTEVPASPLTVPAVPGNPANKVLTNDLESNLFLDTQGVNQATYANGAFSSLSEQNAITFATPNDASGMFSVVLRINEKLAEVLTAQIIPYDGSATIDLTFPTGTLNGLSLYSDKIVLNANTSINLGTAIYNACLVVRYTVKL